uniref:Uncharacterized protein n=1 Tax=Panagrolaimus sp. ES5 TaxID=591445 RepID=A0AC34G3F8_9BILA
MTATDERFLNGDIEKLSETQINFIRNLYEQVYHCAQNVATLSSNDDNGVMSNDNNHVSSLQIFDNIFENLAVITVIFGSVYGIYTRYYKLQQQLIQYELPKVVTTYSNTSTVQIEEIPENAEPDNTSLGAWYLKGKVV